MATREQNILCILHDELSQARSQTIKQIMPRLQTYWQSGHWLEQNNSFIQDRKNNINKFKWKSDPSVHAHLADYIAASVFGHAFDGWAFLGRAIAAELAGDPDSARHLAYYAELRAGISFLASQGIGVFNNKHILVEDSQSCRISKVKDGTHLFTWYALNTLANQTHGVEAVLSAIKPQNVPLDDWIKCFSGSGKFLATTWLQQWGFDLKQLTKDRESRNIASYHPTPFTSPGPRTIESAMEDVLHFWEICSPGVRGGFPELDLKLLQNCLLHLTKELGKNQYEKRLEYAISQLGLTSHGDSLPTSLSWKNLRQQCEVLKNASLSDPETHLNHSTQVLARATLLLRVATGCAANLLDDAGLVPKDLEFWWINRSVNRCLWPNSSPPVEFNELWIDIEDAISDIRDWLEKHSPQVCRYELWTKMPPSILTTTERVFLWGIE